MTVNDVIQDRCQQSKALSTQTMQLAPAIHACCRRHDLAVCAVDLALEHHRSIAMLIEAGELGSAAALMRPLLEAAASASWLVYAATDDRIMTLPTDPKVVSAPQDIPTLSKMADALLPYFPAMSTLIEGLASAGPGSARWLHKYTHGGTPQLARRDRANGWLEGDVILGLIRADMFAMAAAASLTATYKNAAFNAHVFRSRDALAVEFNAKFGTPMPPPPPHQMPIPDKGCCGTPLLVD